MANRFRLTSLLSDSDKKDRALKEYYKKWKELNLKSKASFTLIDNSFFKNEYIKNLEAGPLRLYLFFSYVASNDYGHSWYSVQSIADQLNVNTRTIDNWIKVLSDNGLIYRAPKGSKSYTTYLIPFSDTLIFHPTPKKQEEDNQELLDNLITSIRDLEFLYGEIIQVHHLFQWTSQKGKPINRDNSKQMLLIITKRKNGVLIGHLNTLRNSDHLSVSELDIQEPSIFKSPFTFNGEHITGLALTPFPTLQTPAAIRDTIDLVSELSNIKEWELKDRPELEYGNKDDILPEIEEDTSENNDESNEEENDE